MNHIVKGGRVARRFYGLVTAALCVAAAPLTPVQAQSVWYRCPMEGGGTTLSDRPCGQGRTSITSYGPVQEPVRPPAPPAAPLRRAPDHLSYLTPHCAQLNDAVRTAPNRGLRGQALQDLYDTYRRECSDDEQAALQQLYRQRQQTKDSERARRNAEQAARNEVQLQREQCDEMQRILHARRQRMDTLTEGQKADLQRFQDNYTQRCRAG